MSNSEPQRHGTGIPGSRAPGLRLHCSDQHGNRTNGRGDANAVETILRGLSLFPAPRVRGDSCWESVNLNPSPRGVTIELCATKTDPRALTTVRTWSCVCPSERGLTPIPVQRASSTNTWFANFVDKDGYLPTRLSFFPASSGDTACKTGVVAATEDSARLMNLRIGELVANSVKDTLLCAITMAYQGAAHDCRVWRQLVVA